MSTQKFNVGDLVKYTPSPEATTCRVIVAEPDSSGRIVIEHLGRYYPVLEKNYELAPKRYVVEHRIPKVGEQYFSYMYGSPIRTLEEGDPIISSRAVVVEDAS